MILRLFFLFLLVYSLIAQGAEPLIRVGMTEGGHEKEHTQVFDETRDALIKKIRQRKCLFRPNPRQSIGFENLFRRG